MDDQNELRPLLLAAVARLRSQGFVTDEAHDLIGDFFLEAWPGLQERFDASRGSFRTYVYGAFLRFARPRIVKAARLRDLCQFDLSNIPAQDPSEFSEHELEAVQHALASLAPAERRALELRFEAGLSERQAALAMHVSRHAFRETAAEALARLAVSLRTTAIPDSDRRVVSALWTEERPLEEVAETFGVSRENVRRIRERVISVFRAALGRRRRSKEIEDHD